jgi:putative RNA 2'-phosphotransferase
MDEKARTALSKFLSLVLRHRPDSIGIQFDQQGWVAIDSLLTQAQSHGKPLTRAVLDEIVATNAKQRFAISDDGLRIRASQGHSVDVDLGYAPATPPEILFHGTTADRLASIQSQGLSRMQRHHVHLSADVATAKLVGARHGKPAVLRVHAGRMQRDGREFFLSANGVWLTDAVPPDYLETLDTARF